MPHGKTDGQIAILLPSTFWAGEQVAESALDWVQDPSAWGFAGLELTCPLPDLRGKQTEAKRERPRNTEMGTKSYGGN